MKKTDIPIQTNKTKINYTKELNEAHKNTLEEAFCKLSIRIS
jgi:hypothetical protein